MYVVYILVNGDRNRTYVGQTRDLAERLRLHNAGGVRSTRGHGRWEVLHTEECPSRSAAMERERYYKSAVGRKQIAKLLQERCPSG